VASSIFAGPAPLAEATPAAFATSFSRGPVIAATTVESSSGTGGLVLTLGSSLVGAPSATAEQVAAVGPGTQAGVTALAANTTGVLQGIAYGQSLTRVSPYGEVPPTTDNADADTTTAPGDDDTASESEPLDGALATPAEPPAPSQDQRTLAAASDWLGGLGSALLSLFGSSPQSPVEPLTDPRPAAADTILLAHDGQPEAKVQQVEHADLATPLGLGVISVLVLRARRPVSRWMGRKNGRNGRWISAAKTAVKGPHARI